MRSVLVPLSLVLSLGAPAFACGLGWYTTLSGPKAVPPSPTSFSGIGLFVKKGNGLQCNVYSTLHYGVARLHEGAPGTNGPELGIIKKGDAVGHWLGVVPLDDHALAQLEAGNLYVEITSLLVPDVVRGQVTMTYGKDGEGCATSAGIPSLGGSGLPTPGSTITLTSSGAPALAPAWLILSTKPIELTGGGCTLLADPSAGILVPYAYGSTGAWSSGPLPVPTLPVAQIPLYLQALVADPLAPNGTHGASARLTIVVSTYPY